MKFLSLISFIGAVYTANAVQYSSYGNTDDYFYFAGDDDDTLQLINTTEPIDDTFIEQYTQDPNNNGYWLFTRSNPNSPQVLRFGDNSSVLRSNFNKQKNTVFLVHGWQGDRSSAMNVLLTAALDPAGPLWSIDNERITHTDGIYVEVIHTNTALLGYTGPCGDADFYPNGGASMTGCRTVSCSHSRSYEYMAASIKFNNFLANECGSLWNARRDTCSGDQEQMGNSDLTPKRPGIYRVDTDKSYPY